MLFNTSIMQARLLSPVCGHSAVVFGMRYHGFKVIILFGGRRRAFGEYLSETTLLLLSK